MAFSDGTQMTRSGMAARIYRLNPQNIALYGNLRQLLMQ
jgi:hypothetical protein